MGFLKSPLCLFGSHPKDKGRLLTRVDLCHYVKWLSLRLRWPQLPAVRSNLWWLYCTVCAACYISTRPHWLQAKLFCLLLDVIESILGAGVGGGGCRLCYLCAFVCICVWERERSFAHCFFVVGFFAWRHSRICVFVGVLVGVLVGAGVFILRQHVTAPPVASNHCLLIFSRPDECEHKWHCTASCP